ncbi:PP0621 family protein [Azoarcus sp. TTM-91]|uniref:PP0621 family protein n=1 Tax=Azoarcus sp. TTM-91 TaxID=2691581 RepID=UPI001B7CF0A3|nr:PP0621 family protein [Azoarcus sp. TTM-91]
MLNSAASRNPSSGSPGPASTVRNLLLFLLLLFAVWWIRRKFAAIGAARRGAQENRRERGGIAGPERILECAHCGIHVPESEGLAEQGRFYCCEAHRRLGAGKRED